MQKRKQILQRNHEIVQEINDEIFIYPSHREHHYHPFFFKIMLNIILVAAASRDEKQK